VLRALARIGRSAVGNGGGDLKTGKSRSCGAAPTWSSAAWAVELDAEHALEVGGGDGAFAGWLASLQPLRRRSFAHQLCLVDLAESKEDLGLGIEPGSDAVERGG